MFSLQGQAEIKDGWERAAYVMVSGCEAEAESCGNRSFREGSGWLNSSSWIIGIIEE